MNEKKYTVDREDAIALHKMFQEEERQIRQAFLYPVNDRLREFLYARIDSVREMKKNLIAITVGKEGV